MIGRTLYYWKNGGRTLYYWRDATFVHVCTWYTRAFSCNTLQNQKNSYTGSAGPYITGTGRSAHSMAQARAPRPSGLGWLRRHMDQWAFNRPAACAPSKNIVSGPSVRRKLGPHIDQWRFALLRARQTPLSPRFARLLFVPTLHPLGMT